MKKICISKDWMFSSPEKPDQVRLDLPHDLSKEDFMRGYPDIGWGGIDTAWDKLTEGYMEPLDIVGYNYLYERYEYDHKNYPQRVIWGSETHALNFYRSWQSVMRNSYVVGDFTWTAYDNLGEAGLFVIRTIFLI